MLEWASKHSCDVRVLSDCNAVFISHILKGEPACNCLCISTIMPAHLHAAHGPARPSQAPLAARLMRV